MREWLEDHEYESIEQIKGIMSQKSCPTDRLRARAIHARAEELFQSPSSTAAVVVRHLAGQPSKTRPGTDRAGVSLNPWILQFAAAHFTHLGCVMRVELVDWHRRAEILSFNHVNAIWIFAHARARVAQTRRL